MSGPIQFEQGDLGQPLTVLFTGSQKPIKGGIVTYDHDVTDSDRNTQAGKRSSEVQRPTLAQILNGQVAGVISDRKVLKTGEQTIEVIKPGGYGSFGGLPIATNANIALGDLLGPVPGSFYASNTGGLFGESILAVAQEAQDRSSTAGTVFARLDPKLSRSHIKSRLYEFVLDAENLPLDLMTETTVDGGSDGAEVLAPSSTTRGITIGTNNASGDGTCLQVAGEQVSLASGKPVYIEGRIESESVITNNIFMGVAVTDTDVLAGVTDRVGLQILAANQNVTVVAEKNSTETLDDSEVDRAASSVVEFAIFFDGDGTLTYWVNDMETPKGTITTNIPDDENLTPTIQVDTSAAAIATVHVELRVAAVR